MERDEEFRKKVESENKLIEEKQREIQNDLEIEKQRVMREYQLLGKFIDCQHIMSIYLKHLLCYIYKYINNIS